MKINLKNYKEDICILCNNNIGNVCPNCYDPSKRFFQFINHLDFVYLYHRYQINIATGEVKRLEYNKGYITLIYTIKEEIDIEELINKVDKFEVFK